MKNYCYRLMAYISSNFIRNRGQGYMEGWPDYLTNNPPPTLIFVRLAPSMQNKDKQAYWINGIERPRLKLTRDKKYQFNIITQGQPFYLTTDPTGGDGSKGNLTALPPVDFHLTTFIMTSSMPQTFYYQSSKTAGIGGEIVIL